MCRCLRNDTTTSTTQVLFTKRNSAKYVYMALEVVHSVVFNDSADALTVTDGDGETMADDGGKMDYSPLFETNDNAPTASVGDDNVEERFRVDRRKLEQLIQGRTYRDHDTTFIHTYVIQGRHALRCISCVMQFNLKKTYLFHKSYLP